MAQDVVLKPRQTGKGAARACRRSGLVPGIIYGKSVSPIAVALDAKAVKKIMSRAGGHIHHVVVENPPFEGDVMVQDATYDPINRKPLHVDLHKISLTEKVRTEVPVAVTGESALEKGGLILQRQLRKVMVECLPTDIPDSVVVNVAELDHGETITAGELTLPTGVRLVTAPAEVLVVAVVPKAVEEKVEEKPEEVVAAPEAAAEPKAEKPEVPKD